MISKGHSGGHMTSDQPALRPTQGSYKTEAAGGGGAERSLSLSNYLLSIYIMPGTV